MRSLEKNKRKFYYANLVGTEPLYDEYGNETGEVKKIYSDIEEAKANISANAGEEALNVFGSQTDYSRTIVTTSTNLKEKARVWFGIDTSEPHNYVVTRIADSINGYLIALKQVNENYD